VTNRNIKKVSTGYSSGDGIYYLKIDIDENSAALLKTMTAGASSSSPVTLYYFFDGVRYQSNNFQATSQYAQSSLYLYSREATSLDVYKSILDNGVLPIDIDFVSYEYAAPLLGEYAALIAGILVIALALAVIAALVIKYKLLGTASSLSFLVYLLGIFLLISLAYIPMFDIGALMGVVFAMALYLFTSAYFLNTLNGLTESVKEFSGEKQLLVLLGRTRRHTTLHLVRIHAVLLVASAVMWIFGIGALSSFAVVMTYASLLSLLADLFVFRLFARLFIAISPNENLYYGAVKKEEKV
jgi:preprotein translocase subunit SecD